ncbi:MAG: cohesin domain-containing protein [Bacteroidales bacterium]
MMNQILTIFFSLIFLNVIDIQAQNAPASTVGAIFSYGATATVPVSVTGFNNVGSCNLRWLYDPAVATCTGVTKSASLPGGLAVNTDTPGVITIGWYTWPGVTLPDHTVVFNLNFSKAGFGITDISWDENYPDRNWGDGNFQIMNDLPLSDYYIPGSLGFLTGNAPVTIAPVITGTPGTTINIPVKVSDFLNIGSLSLTMQYNPTVLSYQSFSNTAGFPGLMADGFTPGTIVMTGLVPPVGTGFTLADEAVLFTLDFHYVGGTTALTWFDDGPSCQYAGYPGYNILSDSPTQSYYINGSVNAGIRIGLKLFLEGPFMGGEMSTQLNNLDLIPNDQPYSGTPWNYTGTEYATAIPADAVDWVLIELRETTGDASTATSNKVVARQAGLLMKNGQVKQPDGNQNLYFGFAPVANLFVVVYHRNHLAVITATAVSFFNGLGYYDLSSGALQVLGGADGHKELTPGIWGMIAGDSDGDGLIDDADKMDYWSPNAGTNGYLSFDFSMDAEIKNQDKNDYWYWNLGSESQVP